MVEIIVNLRTKPVSSIKIGDQKSFTCPFGPSIEAFGTLEVPAAIEHSLNAIRNGFKAGLEPCLSVEGTSGSYILKNSLGSTE